MLRDNSEVNKNFLEAVKVFGSDDSIDDKYLDQLLAEGADINVKFGPHAIDKHDACSFCGPQDTPLSHAIKRNHLQLMTYLLQHGANTELVNGSDDATPLLNVCSESMDSCAIKLLLDYGANPNAKNNENLTAMHIVFLRFRKWLADKQTLPMAEAVNLLLDAGYVGDIKEITSVLEKRGYTSNKFVITFKLICEHVKLAARLEANKRKYDELNRYIEANNIKTGEGLSNILNNVLRDREAANIVEIKKLEQEKQQEAERLAKVIKKIDLMNKILAAKNEEKSIINYNPAIPFHQQAIKLEADGGTINLVGIPFSSGIPFTSSTVYFQPVSINDNKYYISLTKKTDAGHNNDGVFIYDKLSFEIIDVENKQMFNNITTKDIDSFLNSLCQLSKDSQLKNKAM